MLNEKGILLIATGNPYYGRMAYNLAVTIKAVEQIPIAVLWNERGLSHLSAKQLDIFDQIIEVPGNGFAAKVMLYDYTPFEQTLYMDADTAWLPYKTPSQLIEELGDVEFTGITEGHYNYDTCEDKSNNMYHFWCNPAQAKEKYDLKGKLYQWRSEVIYFRKGAVAKKLFAEAKKVYKNPKVDAKMFAGHIPDELAFNIAAAKQGIEPHREDWRPSYWHRLYGEGRSLADIARNFYILSVGGNFASGLMKTCYNNVCKAAHNKLKLQYVFTLQSKKSVMTDRAKM